MDEGILSLRWNNHSSTVLHTLSTLHQRVRQLIKCIMVCSISILKINNLINIQPIPIDRTFSLHYLVIQ